MGGWGDRPDSLESAAQRLQRSLRLAPDEPDKYGSWGVLQPCAPNPMTRPDLKVVPFDANDLTAVEEAITVGTTRASQGERTGRGLYIGLARDAQPESPDVVFEYSARAGFVTMRQPFNHLNLNVRNNIDEKTLLGYMSALAQAWQPEYLGAVTRETMRSQGHKPPQVPVGRLTFVRAGTPLDVAALGEEVELAAADGGHYIRVPGTPAEPSFDHIELVRQALGYA